MADFYKGFVWEQDRPNRLKQKGVHLLTIEGVPIEVNVTESATGKLFRAKMPSGEREFERRSIRGLAHCYINQSGILKYRKKATKEHLKWLETKDEWNQWRREHPGIKPMFAFDSLTEWFKDHPDHRFDEYDFSYTNFCEADLHGLHFENANFHQAILARANLSGAHLEGANFCRTDLYETNLSGAYLNGANLQAALMVKTNLTDADVSECQVYGLSAWDLQLENPEKKQKEKQEKPKRLEVRYEPFSPLHRSHAKEEVVEVEGLDMAGFIYLTLNNRNIKRIFATAGRQWVLLLGRFTGNGKKVLQEISKCLKRSNLIPIIFDFPPPDERDLVETIILLGGMSKFIIVDMTDPRSIPMELQAIVPNFGVPVVPVMEKAAKVFGTFSGLRKYPWVRETIKYDQNRPDQIIDRLRKSDPSLLASPFSD